MFTIQFYEEKKSEISPIETIIYIPFVTEFVVCFFDTIVLEVFKDFFDDLFWPNELFEVINNELSLLLFELFTK